MDKKSRAEYFRKRREGKRVFTTIIDGPKMELLEKKLQEKGQTKINWINQKIDEEIGE